MRQISIVAWLMATIASIAGCGGQAVPEGMLELHAVQVTVSQGGSPIPDATVMFQPEDNGQWHASGVTDSDGVAVLRTNNEFDGVPPGEYGVKITKTEAVETGDTEVNDAGETVPVLFTKQLLAEKYASFATSGLKATVSDGPKELEFDLTQ